MKTNCVQECNFTNPVGLEPADDPKDKDFEFSKMSCQIVCEDLDETIELVENPVYPNREFYIEKTFSYGEAIVAWFLTLFLLLGIASLILKLFLKR